MTLSFQHHINTGYGIVKEIGNAPTGTREQAAFAGMVRTHSAGMTGISRANLHYVPLYSKGHISEILETYKNDISLYKQDYDRLLDQTTSNADFISYAKAMHHIYIATDVNEAKGALEDALHAVGRANGTYNRMDFYYDLACESLDAAKVEFEKGIQQAQQQALRKALFNFVKGIFMASTGNFSENPFDIIPAITTMFAGSDGLGGVIKEVGEMMATVDELVRISDENMEHLQDLSQAYNPEKYIEDIQIMASLKATIEQWQSLKHYSDVVLADPASLEIGGCAMYTRAVYELCNWGEALTAAMVERAEMMRSTMEKRLNLDAKLEMKVRIEQAIADMEDNIASREETLVAMIEETYDVRIALNEALLYFCQAYFFEKLQECKSSYAPAFGGSLSDLLIKISLAQRDDLLDQDPPSSTHRIVTITDEDTDPECADATKCPINYFRNNRILYFNLPTDHRELIDLHKYRLGTFVCTCSLAG